VGTKQPILKSVVIAPYIACESRNEPGTHFRVRTLGEEQMIDQFGVVEGVDEGPEDPTRVFHPTGYGRSEIWIRLSTLAERPAKVVGQLRGLGQSQADPGAEDGVQEYGCVSDAGPAAPEGLSVDVAEP
jgi:hypothetical protein